MKRITVLLLGAFLLTNISAMAQVDTTDMADAEQKVKWWEKEPKLPYKKKLEYADNLYEAGNYFQAEEKYLELLNDKPENAYLVFQIANSLRQSRDYKKAETWYVKTLDMDRSGYPVAEYYLAKVMQMQGKYEEAKNNYGSFVAASVSAKEEDYKRKAKLGIEACDFAVAEVADPGLAEVTHLEPPINKPFSDFAPSVSGDVLFYSSLNNDSTLNRSFQDKGARAHVYQSKLVNGTWAAGEPLSRPINGDDAHSANTTFTADAKRMYFTKCTAENGEPTITCKIYLSVSRNGIWSEPVELSKSVNAPKANNTHPAVGGTEGDTDILYFTSDREGGQGGMDIYYAEVKATGVAGLAENLGEVINTPDDDKTPFYYEPKGTLYFSSDGHKGLGGFDVLMAEGAKKEWGEVTNLGYPINSAADDHYYAKGEDKKLWYMVSNRPGIIGLKSETCCDDIFRVKDLFIPKFAISGKVKEREEDVVKGAIEDVTLEVYEINGDERILISKVPLRDDDEYFYDLEAYKDYEVEYKKQGFFTEKRIFELKPLEESDTFFVDVGLEKIRKDKAYSLSKIYYEYNSAALTEDSKQTLDELFKILNENPDLVFELSSHTDSIGSTGYNQKLSQQRAQSCVTYLVDEKGVSKDRIIAKGYGESEPIAPNSRPDGSDNPEGRAKNRRTEYKVIGELENAGDKLILD